MNGTKPKILIIDDSKAAREQYASIFADRADTVFMPVVGFDPVDRSAWKRRLRAWIEREEPDLLILDLALDSGDPNEGLTVIRFLTGELSVKVFVCSKYIPQEGSDAPDSRYSRDSLVGRWGACDARRKYPFPDAEHFLQHVPANDDAV